MLSINGQYSPEYLLGPVAHGRESYYTGAVAEGEPPGVWSGEYAAAHGLVGEVDHQDMRALFSRFLDPADPRFRQPAEWEDASTLGRPPFRYRGPGEKIEAALAAEPNATPERRAELRQDARQSTRQAVAYIDATFSVQKSVTVAHAAFEYMEVRARLAGDIDEATAWATMRGAIEAGIQAGNQAGLEYLRDRAGYSRVGHHSSDGGRYIDAHDLIVASFFQHTSREDEPQLHIHNAILNRVRCADGEWRTLDSRAIHRYRGGGGAVMERVMEEHISRSLGVVFRTRPDGKAREIVGVPVEVMALMSKRRRAITGRTAKLVEEFEAQEGRPPNPLELDRIQRRATLATRKAKSHTGETRAQMFERIIRELRAELDTSLEQVARTIVANKQHQPQPAFSPQAVVDAALARVQDGRSTWNRGDLTRAIGTELPDHLGTPDGRTVREIIEWLADRAERQARDLSGPAPTALPEELRLEDGRSAYEAPAGKRFATPDHLDAERALQHAAVERGAPAVPASAAAKFLDRLAAAGRRLGEDQAAALTGFLTSGAKVEVLIGPAGTGKSFTVAAMTAAWEDLDLWGGQQRRVFGVAASQKATNVLAGEGVRAKNIARWLALQARLADGHPTGDDEEWTLTDGDVVFVDESAMASTTNLTQIHAHVATAGAKLVLVGDHRQLGAVGAGGVMALVAEHGITYELTDVRRFNADWEGAASLRLRDRDKSVLPLYRQHGRLVDGGERDATADRAAQGWLADYLEGRESLLVTDTNEDAYELSARIRSQLVDLGRVEETGVPVAGGLVAGVGDLVESRKPDRSLKGFEGNLDEVVNRMRYTVTSLREDGGVVATRSDGTVFTLPGTYVREHLTLGYAGTIHSGQGATIDTTHVVITGRSSANSLYVGLTRGRDNNTAYVQTLGEQEDAPPGDGWEPTRRDPSAAAADVLDREQESMSALAEEAELDERERSIRWLGQELNGEIEMLGRARATEVLDAMVSAGELDEAGRVALAADQAMGPLARLLRSAELAGLDPAAVLRDGVSSRTLAGVESPASAVYSRIKRAYAGELTPRGDTFTDRMPAAEGLWSLRMQQLAEMADDRRRALSEEVVADPPRWAVRAFGPVPDEVIDRAEWQSRASTVAAYREMAGHADPDTALGPAPKPGQVEHHAAWHAGWRALGRPEADRDEALMSDGQLWMRWRAYEREKNWEPAFVADELTGVNLERADARQRATLAAAAGRDAEARDLAARADELDTVAAELDRASDVRAEWFIRTSPTRVAAARAEHEFGSRGIDPNRPPDAITADQWEAERRAELAESEPYRAVTETDVATRRPVVEDVHEDATETAVPDVRDTSTPLVHGDDGTPRIPTAEEVAEKVARAQVVLAEIQARRDYESSAEREHEEAAWAYEAREAAARQVRPEDLVEVR